MVETLNIAISWGLLILIWLVQIIIYPGFHNIPENTFDQYHRWYAARISFLAIPLMLFEIPAVTQQKGLMTIMLAIPS